MDRSTMGETRGPLPFVALAWRWAARAAAGYVTGAVLLVVGFSAFQPGDWSRAGGLGSFVVSYTFWIVLMTPVLAVAGVAVAVVVWLSLLVSRGSITAAAVAAGVGVTVVSLVFVLVYSEPRGPDLLGYLVMGAALGALAAWLTIRDVSRIPSVTRWIGSMHLREGSPTA